MRPRLKIPLASSANTTISFNAYDFSQESLFSHISVHVHAKDRQGKTKQNKTKQMMQYGPNQEAL